VILEGDVELVVGHRYSFSARPQSKHAAHGATRATVLTLGTPIWR
jgi:hypothetical protein